MQIGLLVINTLLIVCSRMQDFQLDMRRPRRLFLCISSTIFIWYCISAYLVNLKNIYHNQQYLQFNSNRIGSYDKVFYLHEKTIFSQNLKGNIRHLNVICTKCTLVIYKDITNKIENFHLTYFFYHPYNQMLSLNNKWFKNFNKIILHFLTSTIGTHFETCF